MADEYSAVTKGTLKLKGVTDGKVKKKKKKNKAKEVVEDIKSTEQSQPKEPVDSRTPAQKAFDRIKEKRSIEEIMRNAEKTHKQRVEEFNSNLDKLTEHYDIPKVSWTK